ncbi:MAG: hypothetical protein NXH75_06330 [Halobacteriovoraceae bacterium]|nr:hypothetical protein [Halobacteriovoraceae bacterium]
MVNPKSQIKITGVFDDDSFTYFKEKGLFHFGFDLRPKSYNFIQEYALIPIVEKLTMGSITLLFENEKDYVIKRILDEISKKYSGEIVLEFYGNEDHEFFDSFSLPYVFVLKNNVPSIVGRNQVGVLLYQEYLNELIELEKVYDLKIDDVGRIILTFENKLNFPQSVTDFLDWNLLNLEIDQRICTSYRKLNQDLIEELLKHMENFIKGRPAI